MNRQSTVIFGTLLFAFFIFITVRGDLPEWISLFSKTGEHTSATIQDQQAAAPKKSGGIFGKILSVAGVASNFIPGIGPMVSAGISAAGAIAAK